MPFSAYMSFVKSSHEIFAHLRNNKCENLLKKRKKKYAFQKSGNLNLATRCEKVCILLQNISAINHKKMSISEISCEAAISV